MSTTSRRNEEAHAESGGAYAKSKIVIGRAYLRSVLPMIQNAKISIDILMFHWAFYQKDLSCEVSQINLALLNAHKRGVRVRAYCNMQNTLRNLRAIGIASKIYTGSGIMHAKLLIFDQKIALLGSHNFSQNAMCFNKEISILVDTPAEIEQLMLYFEALWRMSI